MPEMCWRFGNTVPPERKERLICWALVLLCGSALAGVLWYGQMLEPTVVRDELYRRDQVTVAPLHCSHLVKRVENHLRGKKRPYPPIPKWLRQEARALATGDPRNYAAVLLQYTDDADPLQLKAICYCLKAGLDNKHVLLAFQQLGRRMPQHTEMLKNILVQGVYRKSTFTLESEWIPYPSDGGRPFWIVK